MIAILQFDAASPAHLEDLLAQGKLPALERLRSRGIRYDLETPATYFEGAAAYSLYTGTMLGQHGLYYPWQWSAAEQRVRFIDDFPAPEALWERTARAGRRSLIIDPYEMRTPPQMNGLFVSGWQFKNRVVLRPRSIPRAWGRSLTRQLGRPPRGEEIYGRPVPQQLIGLKNSLVAAPRRGADAIESLLKSESFDLVWISLSAAHLGGHRFFDIARFADEINLERHTELVTALEDIYRSVDEAVGRIVASLPPECDIVVCSPSGMGPNNSRSHLLPGMLSAVLTNGDLSSGHSKKAPGSSLWRIRALAPTRLRSWIAGALPDRWALELAARLELRNVEWHRTQGFVMPNDDAGYVRLNLRGRERDGIVDPSEAESLLEKIASGLMTFRNPEDDPVIEAVVPTREIGLEGPFVDQLPDLVVVWSERVVSPLLGVSSPRYGEVASLGFGTGRTGCHTGDAWAIVVPGSSKLKQPTQPPHIIDLAATVCSVLEVDPTGLYGQPLLELPTRRDKSL